MVLVIVLVVIAVLTLASYTFSELMMTEHQATRVVARQAQARALAESGAEMVRIFVQQTSDAISQAGGTYDNATQFQGVIVYDDGTSKGRGRFSVVAPRIENGVVTGVRYRPGKRIGPAQHQRAGGVGTAKARRGKTTLDGAAGHGRRHLRCNFGLARCRRRPTSQWR